MPTTYTRKEILNSLLESLADACSELQEADVSEIHASFPAIEADVFKIKRVLSSPGRELPALSVELMGEH